MATRPYTPVDPIPLRLPRYGLYAAATVIDLPDGPWEDGVAHISDNCSDGFNYKPCCPPTPPTPRAVTFTLAGDRTGTLPDFVYTVKISAGVDSGPVRNLTAKLGSGPTVSLSTNGTQVTIHTDELPADATLVLTDVATGTSSSTPIAQNVPGIVTPGSIVLLLQDPAPAVTKPTNSSVLIESDPFVIGDGYDCHTVTFEEGRRRVALKFAGSEPKQVEKMFQHGDQWPSLKAATKHGEPDGLSVVEGLSLAEDLLATQYNGVGIVHMARRLIPYLANRELLGPLDGAALTTPGGTRYAFGSGYDDHGPDGVAPPAGKAWIYVTGPLTIRRSPVTEVEGRGRDGCVVAIAERTVVISTDCMPLHAILVDLAKCDCGPTNTP